MRSMFIASIPRNERPIAIKGTKAHPWFCQSDMGKQGGSFQLSYLTTSLLHATQPQKLFLAKTKPVYGFRQQVQSNEIG